MQVAPWPPAPEARSTAQLAEDAFSGTTTPTNVVRRHRVGASPLVRDAVGGRRTGTLDRVLAGDFDLF